MTNEERYDAMRDEIIDLKNIINLLQEEKQNLEIELKAMRGAANSLKMHYEEAQAKIKRLKKYDEERDIRLHTKLTATAKSEAIKEFAGTVRRYIKSYCNPYGKPTLDYDTSVKIMHFIDNLVKAMGDDSGKAEKM